MQEAEVSFFTPPAAPGPALPCQGLKSRPQGRAVHLPPPGHQLPALGCLQLLLPPSRLRLGWASCWECPPSHLLL